MEHAAEMTADCAVEIMVHPGNAGYADEEQTLHREWWAGLPFMPARELRRARGDAAQPANILSKIGRAPSRPSGCPRAPRTSPPARARSFANATTRGMSAMASTRSLASRDRLVERPPARERPAEHHLGAILERDRGQQIAVAAEAEHRALLGAGGGGDARGLVDAARDQRGEQARARARLAREADADRRGSRPAPRPTPGRADRACRRRGARGAGRRRVTAAMHLGVVRAAHHRRGAALASSLGLHRAAERADAARGRLLAHDVRDRLERIAAEAADAVDDEVRAVEVIAERAQHLARHRRRAPRHDEPRPRDLGVVGR